VKGEASANDDDDDGRFSSRAEEEARDMETKCGRVSWLVCVWDDDKTGGDARMSE
jgi:hypothetical protein